MVKLHLRHLSCFEVYKFRAQITKLTSQFARCQIVSVGEEKLSDPLRGMIRKEDVRSSDRDKVEMHKCFRPGDLAIAKVVSLLRFLEFLTAKAVSFFDLWLVMLVG